MARFLSLVALVAWVATPSVAQSDLSTSPAAFGASASYTGAVYRTTSRGLEDLRVPAVSADVSSGRVIGGIGVAFFESEIGISLAAGFHIARNPARQLATTLSTSVQFLEDDTTVIAPSISHGRRVYQRPGLALVPGAAVGLAVSRGGTRGGEAGLFGSTGLGIVIGGGSTRGVVTPSVSVSLGQEGVVSLGLSAGIVQSLGR